MKRIIIFFTMILLLGFGVNAQTLSTDTYNTANGNMPVVGTNFDVPIDVTGIGEIFTLTVYVEYDNTTLTYTGFANAFPNTEVTNQTANVLKVFIGDFPNPSTIPDGKLLDLQFDYNGGYSDLTFGVDTDTYKSTILQTTYAQWYFAAADVTNGAVQGYFDNIISGGDWNIATNWSSGMVSNEYANAIVASGTETTIDAAAISNDLNIELGGKLTLNDALNVGGDFLIESTATGSGSFINNGTLTVTGTTSAECYVTNAQWHGISAPVIGEDLSSMYLGGSPFVWIKEYDEATNDYTLIQDINTPMGDMKGWFTWIEAGSSPQTFTFEGDFRTGTVGSANNMVHSALGHNFVGNAFTSAIDWDAANGWTKTNLYDATYAYNNGNWATYVAGAGTNGGSRYIAMSQGFFVQVDGAGPGTLTMDNQVCVHDDIPYLKDQVDQEIIRLEIEDNGLIDETVVRLIDGATVEYDGNYDAGKFFSLNDDYPQIYSTANNFMSINSLPFEYEESIAMDVRGKDGNSMTITATESEDFEELYLKDEFTGDITDLKIESYTFTYNAEVNDRFSLLFGTIGVNEDPLSNNSVRIFAYDKNIHVVLDAQSNADVTVYNLMGQKITSRSANSTVTLIPVLKSGYYVVKVSDGKYVSSQKVFIK